MPVIMATNLRSVSVSRNAQMAIDARRRHAGPETHGIIAVTRVSCNMSSAILRHCAGRTFRCVSHPSKHDAAPLPCRQATTTPLSPHACARRPVRASAAALQSSHPPSKSSARDPFLSVVLPTAVTLMLCNMDRICMSIAILPMAKEFAWPASVQVSVGRWAGARLGRGSRGCSGLSCGRT